MLGEHYPAEISEKILLKTKNICRGIREKYIALNFVIQLSRNFARFVQIPLEPLVDYTIEYFQSICCVDH